MSASIAPRGSNLAPAVAPGRPLAMVARNCSEYSMDGPTDRSKKHKPKRDSDRGEEGNRADPPNVRLEERPDVGEREMPKSFVEEGAPRRADGKPQWRPLRKNQWSTRRPAFAREPNRLIRPRKMIRPQKGVVLLSLLFP